MKKNLTGEELMNLESKLLGYTGSDRIVSSHELYEEMKQSKEPDEIIPTGIPTLDRLHAGGFEPGELVVVTGLAGDGKTALLMSVTKNMKEVKSAWFTLEVTPKQFLKKIMKDSELPLFYLPREISENQIEWIHEKIVEAKLKYGVKVVFIDHIHQIFSLVRANNLNISLEIGDLVAKIKQIALTYNLVIFLVAHCKDDATGGDREPTMYSIRDSGLINRLADSVVSVWRVPNDHDIEKDRRRPLGENDNKAKIRLCKNRREGKLGSWFMEHENHHLKEHALLL